MFRLKISLPVSFHLSIYLRCLVYLFGMRGASSNINRTRHLHVGKQFLRPRLLALTLWRKRGAAFDICHMPHRDGHNIFAQFGCRRFSFCNWIYRCLNLSIVAFLPMFVSSQLIHFVGVQLIMNKMCTLSAFALRAAGNNNLIFPTVFPTAYRLSKMPASLSIGDSSRFGSVRFDSLHTLSHTLLICLTD